MAGMTETREEGLYMPGPEMTSIGNKRRAAESDASAKQRVDSGYRHGRGGTPPEGHDDGTDAGADAAYRKFLIENPEMWKKALSKWI